MTAKRTDDLPVLQRAAPVRSIDEEARTIEVVWTTGAQVERFDWLTETRYVEELVVSDAAIRLDRLNAGGPVLDNHRRWESVADAFAVIERAWVVDGEGRAMIRFPQAGIDANADMIFDKVRDGLISSLSCGYRRMKIEIDKSKSPVVWRVVDWEPFEISFVLVPADTGAKVRADDAAKALFRNENVIGRSVRPAASARRIRMRAKRRALI